jgi:hypothetical protein
MLRELAHHSQRRINPLRAARSRRAPRSTRSKTQRNQLNFHHLVPADVGLLAPTSEHPATVGGRSARRTRRMASPDLVRLSTTTRGVLLDKAAASVALYR